MWIKCKLTEAEPRWEKLVMWLNDCRERPGASPFVTIAPAILFLVTWLVFALLQIIALLKAQALIPQAPRSHFVQLASRRREQRNLREFRRRGG
jgi:hypothetical protein